MMSPDRDPAAGFSEIPDPVLGTEASPLPLRLPSFGESPERARVRQRRLAALVLSLAWLTIHLFVYGIRGDFQKLPLFYVGSQIVLPFLVATLSLVIGLYPGRLGLGLRIGLITALAILGPATFCLIALGAPLPAPVPAGAAAVRRMFVCFDVTAIWAAVPLLLASLSLRGGFAAGAAWRGAVIGAGIGLLAGATMNLHCPNIAPAHMLFGHGLPVIVAALVGATIVAYRGRA